MLKFLLDNYCNYQNKFLKIDVHQITA